MVTVHGSARMGGAHQKLRGSRRIAAVTALAAVGVGGCAVASVAASGVGAGLEAGVGARGSRTSPSADLHGHHRANFAANADSSANAGSGAARQWSPPVRPLSIIRSFDPPDRDWLPGHRGVDLRAKLGQQVRAAGSGRIAFASELAGRGVIVVSHGAIRTTYEPVRAGVRRGEEVVAGESLGVIAAGSGHCGDGHCLHFGVRWGRTYLNPRLLLNGFVAALRPW